jgi:hypothetical protein
MLEGVQMSTQHKQVPDPEWVIYDALAKTVSLGVLKWISCSRAAELSVRSAPPDAVAETVSLGVLKWISCSRAAELSVGSAPETDGFWDVEAVDALKGVANYVVTRLQRHGYEINRISA